MSLCSICKVTPVNGKQDENGVWLDRDPCQACRDRQKGQEESQARLVERIRAQEAQRGLEQQLTRSRMLGSLNEIGQIMDEFARQAGWDILGKRQSSPPSEIRNFWRWLVCRQEALERSLKACSDRERNLVVGKDDFSGDSNDQ